MDDYKRPLVEKDIEIGRWLSAALDDPKVCEEMKEDIKEWFNTFEVDIKDYC